MYRNPLSSCHYFPQDSLTDLFYSRSQYEISRQWICWFAPLIFLLYFWEWFLEISIASLIPRKWFHPSNLRDVLVIENRSVSFCFHSSPCILFFKTCQIYWENLLMPLIFWFLRFQERVYVEKGKWLSLRLGCDLVKWKTFKGKLPGWNIVH